jgi:hypothetical protein
MLLFVEQRGELRGERLRPDTRELHPLGPAALTGNDGNGACGDAEGVGEGSDQRVVGRTIDRRYGELDDQLTVTHAGDRRTARARGDAHLAAGAGRGWDEGGHGNAQCRMHNAE